MAVVSTEQLKTRFREGSKPTQDDFYNLIDTFSAGGINAETALSLVSTSIAGLGTNDTGAVSPAGVKAYIDGRLASLGAAQAGTDRLVLMTPLRVKEALQTLVQWAHVQGKPSSYPPATHTHDNRYYRESEINDFFEGVSGGKQQVHWDRISSPPSAYPPATHSHDDRYYQESEINDFFEGVSGGKQRVHWDRITNKPTLTPLVERRRYSLRRHAHGILLDLRVEAGIPTYDSPVGLYEIIVFGGGGYFFHFYWQLRRQGGDPPESGLQVAYIGFRGQDRTSTCTVSLSRAQEQTTGTLVKLGNNLWGQRIHLREKQVNGVNLNQYHEGYFFLVKALNPVSSFTVSADSYVATPSHALDISGSHLFSGTMYGFFRTGQTTNIRITLRNIGTESISVTNISGSLSFFIPQGSRRFDISTNGSRTITFQVRSIPYGGTYTGYIRIYSNATTNNQGSYHQLDIQLLVS